ncbi:MAG: class I SAM-dependent methyltransferase [Pirellulales bacterium]
MDTAQSQLLSNITIHDRVARVYEARHGEIFNDIEQGRLRAALAQALALVRSGSLTTTALDFGCGSGNLSGHLLQLGAAVIACDVSPRFLELVTRRFDGLPVRTHRLNGENLAEIPSDSVDFVGAYSVLHHIPDYLGALEEMTRVCRPGGVISLDHEHSPAYWARDAVYSQFVQEATRVDWRKFCVWQNYVGKLRRFFNPRYANEGDIHVWPDDHIEWRYIEALLNNAGCEIVRVEDYLLYRRIYRSEIYDRYQDRCVDQRLLVARKRI